MSGPVLRPPSERRTSAGGDTTAPPTVAQAVASWLCRELQVDRVFTVPGEAFLPLLAAAPDAGLRIVTTRHESGAGFSAIADARLTGRPGVVAVNRSPGATNASIAFDAAQADATPLLLLVGLPRRGTDPRTGFQATELEPFLGALGAVERVHDAADLPQALARVRAVLVHPRPGPVALLVPEDVWDVPVVDRSDDVEVAPARQRVDARYAAAGVRAALEAAERPVVVAGRLLRTAAGPGPGLGRRLARLGEDWLVPVLAGNKQQDLLDNGHPAYAGHLHLGTAPETVEHLARADLVVFLGDLADEVHLARWYTDQELLVVHPVASGPGDHVLADPLAVLDELTGSSGSSGAPVDEGWQASWRQLETRLSTPPPPVIRPDGVDFAVVAAAMDRHLPDDAVVTLDAGNFSSWVHRYLHLRADQRLLALGGGAMGFGVPGAVAASLRHPERAVVAVVGDGGLLMTGNELAVSSAAGRFPVVIVADNGGYGTIRAHQARRFAAADCGTDLVNPDLCAWAEAFGMPAVLVDRAGDVDAALEHVLGNPVGGLVHVRASRRAVHADFDLPPAGDTEASGSGTEDGR